MWVDRDGRSHSVATEEPGRLLSSDLRRQILGMDLLSAQALLGSLNGYLPELWNDMEGLAPEADESRFENVEPPDTYAPSGSESNDLFETLVEQFAGIPLRWRVDVVFAIIQFILFEMIPFDDDDDDNDQDDGEESEPRATHES